MSELAIPRRRRVSWLFVALAVSLVVNAFFIGAVATDALRLTYAAKRPISFELRWLQDRLSEEDFARVSAAVEANRPAAESHFAELRTLRNELGVLMSAPQPDRAAIDGKLDQIRTAQSTMIRGLQGTIVESVLTLPADARTALNEPLSDIKR